MTLNVAFVGLGRWGNTLGDAAERSEALNIVSCFSRSEERRTAFAARHDCAQDESYESVLARGNVDAVIITAPNNEHCRLAVAAANAGKHVFVEKPIELEISKAKEMIAVCESAGVTLTVGASSRFLRGHRLCRRLIDEGTLGTIAMVETNYSNARGLHYTPNDWQWYASGSPGGPLMQVAIHQIDNFLYLFGPMKRVSAEFRKVLTKSEIPDVCVLWLEFESGLLGTLGTSFISPTTPSGRYTYVLNAYGSEANFYHDRWDGIFVMRHDRDGRERIDYEEYEGFAYLTAELNEFAAAIGENRAPEVGGREGLHVLSVVRAAMLSGELKRPVDLAEVD
ncbi:MAG: Gfo/Idh/MocA family oxidoreductase [Rhizobiales bacterium]|nr:Gfo/Idh/MocA family oxidoreductase [Hyphomicrobiales bacterium]